MALALSGGEESVADVTALSLRTDDLDALLDQVVGLGGSVLRPAEIGPHERRAVVADPSGNPIVVSQKS